MNIISKQNTQATKDPFEQSDRNWNTGAGKGDADRSNRQKFKENFPADMGQHRCRPGKTIFKYS
jgi:hypothetical protein